jgi:hypothetical protein
LIVFAKDAAVGRAASVCFAPLEPELDPVEYTLLDLELELELVIVVSVIFP